MMKRKWRRTWHRTIGRDKDEMMVLTSFSLPIADVEVYMDWGGESLVAIGRDLHQERSL